MNKEIHKTEDRIQCYIRIATNIKEYTDKKEQYMEKYIKMTMEYKTSDADTFQVELDHVNVQIAVFTMNLTKCDTLPIKNIAIAVNKNEMVIDFDKYMCGDIKCSKENHKQWLNKLKWYNTWTDDMVKKFKLVWDKAA